MAGAVGQKTQGRESRDTGLPLDHHSRAGSAPSDQAQGRVTVDGWSHDMVAEPVLLLCTFWRNLGIFNKLTKLVGKGAGQQHHLEDGKQVRRKAGTMPSTEAEARRVLKVEKKEGQVES